MQLVTLDHIFKPPNMAKMIDFKERRFNFKTVGLQSTILDKEILGADRYL